MKEIHLKIQNKEYAPSSLSAENILLNLSNDKNDLVKIKNIFSFFDHFDISPEFDRRIVKKIILRNGYIGFREKDTVLKKKISERYLKEVSVKTDKQPWNIPNPMPGIFAYYFPEKLIKTDMFKKPLFFLKKQKKYMYLIENNLLKI